MKVYLALALSIACLCFTGTTFANSDEIYGTWINMDYKWGRPPQKMIIKPDGTFESFMNADSKIPSWRGTAVIDKQWTDSEGNIWYESRWEGNWGESGYQLTKISNSGKTREYVFEHAGYPKEIDPKHEFYRIYTRLEQ